MACDILSVGSATPQLRDRLSHAAQALRQAGFDVTEHLETGDPEAVIAKAVTDLKADMLVLGKSGHSRLRSLFIGSTTMELMRTCKVPFLIFP
jgi:nucleotide-binding universal stress UspA family protein